MRDLKYLIAEASWNKFIEQSITNILIIFFTLKTLII